MSGAPAAAALCGYIAASCALVFFFPQSVLAFLVVPSFAAAALLRRRAARGKSRSRRAVAVRAPAGVGRCQRLLSGDRHTDRHLRRAGAGSQHRRRLRRLAQSRIRCLLRHRRLPLGDLRLTPGQRLYSGRMVSAVAQLVFRFSPAERRSRRADRRVAGPAGAAPARRLSRHRHPWFCRSRARAGKQPRQAGQFDQRSQRHRPDHQAAAVFRAGAASSSASRASRRRPFTRFISIFLF